MDIELSHGSNGNTPITGEVSLITANGVSPCFSPSENDVLLLN